MSKWVQLNGYGETLGGLAAYARDREEPDDRTRRERRQRVLRQVLEGELTHRQKQVMTLYYFDRKTMPAIAAELGINKSTVSRTIKRGRQQIRKYMGYWF